MMVLQFKLNSKEEISAGHLARYTGRKGAWVLDVGGVADKSKLDKFCANNVALAKERDGLKERDAGIDPDDVKCCRRAAVWIRRRS